MVKIKKKDLLQWALYFTCDVNMASFTSSGLGITYFFINWKKY
jgi:hypothetical protein